MFAKIISGIKTRPLFYVFIVLFCLIFIFAQIFTDVTRRYKVSENKKMLSGEVYREPWNDSRDFILRGRSGGETVKVLVFGRNVDSCKFTQDGACTLKNVSLIKPATEGNFYAFDYCKYLLAHDIDYIVYAEPENLEKCVETDISHSISYYSWRIRFHIEKCLEKYLSKDFSGLVMSVMTGDTGGLESSSKEYLSKSGFSHLVAVSGAHVAFLSGPLSTALKRTLLRHGKRNVVMLIPPIFLWFIAGATPSVTRAVIMCIMACAGAVLKKRNDALNSLGLSGIVQILSNPFSIYSTGFILSYLSTASILIILPVIGGRKKHSKIFRAFLPGISVNLGMLPISVYLFNSFSPCGFLLNVFAAEIASVLCIGGYLVFVLDKIPVVRFLIRIGANALVSLSYVFEKISEKTGRGGAWFFGMEFKTPSVAGILIYYLLLAAVLLIIRKKRADVPVIAAIILGVFMTAGALSERTEVLFFDVGQGTGALIKTCDGIAGMVDTGTGNVKIGELLKKEGVKKLDFVILSHGHNDHYGGLEEIIENIKPETVYVPLNESDEYLMNLGDKYNLNVKYIDREEKLVLGKYTLLEAYEPEAPTEELNNGSLVVKLSGKWGSILLPGDAETDEQENLMNRGIDLSADVLCLGHHGSYNAGGEKFLCEVCPKYAIISVGHNNTYGHPSDIVLKRLCEQGMLGKNIYRTDDDGAVRITFGNNIFGKGFVKVWRKRLRVS